MSDILYLSLSDLLHLVWYSGTAYAWNVKGRKKVTLPTKVHIVKTMVFPVVMY